MELQSVPALPPRPSSPMWGRVWGPAHPILQLGPERSWGLVEEVGTQCEAGVWGRGGLDSKGNDGWWWGASLRGGPLAPGPAGPQVGCLPEASVSLPVQESWWPVVGGLGWIIL